MGCCQWEAGPAIMPLTKFHYQLLDLQCEEQGSSVNRWLTKFPPTCLPELEDCWYTVLQRALFSYEWVCYKDKLCAFLVFYYCSSFRVSHFGISWHSPTSQETLRSWMCLPHWSPYLLSFLKLDPSTRFQHTFLFSLLNNTNVSLNWWNRHTDLGAGLYGTLVQCMDRETWILEEFTELGLRHFWKVSPRLASPRLFSLHSVSLGRGAIHRG